MVMENWKESNSPFSEFNEEITQNWKKNGFDKEICRKWLEVGMELNDYLLCNWLQFSEKKSPEQFLNCENKKEMKLSLYKDFLDFYKKIFKIDEEMISAQEWLDEEYPLEKRKEIIKLEISNKKLEGELIVKDFDNLEYLECSNNPITALTIKNLPKLDYLIASDCNINNLIVNNCPKIGIFNVRNNLLTDFDFSSLEPNVLSILDIVGNSFPPKNLNFLLPFVKLKRIYLGSSNLKRLSCFYGSLKPLENLKDLDYLDIDSTDINSGLEYLPENFKKISCESGREDTGCLQIKKELEDASQTEGVTEKLQGVVQEFEPEWVKDWYKIAPWRQVRGLKYYREEQQRVSLPEGGYARVQAYKKYKQKVEEWEKLLRNDEKRKAKKLLVSQEVSPIELIKKNPQVKEDWTNIHPNFSDWQLVNKWLNNNFIYQQVQDWANAFGNRFEPNNSDFYVWLRDDKKLNPEQVLNYHNFEELKTEYEQKLITQIEEAINIL